MGDAVPQPDLPDDVDACHDADHYRRAFEEDRRINDLRLKSRFERIFAKYERDFSGIGDEIDLTTGEIVVNNGHLENIKHETDSGENESLRFVQAFADELEHEDDAAGAFDLELEGDNAEDALEEDDLESSDGRSETVADASDYGDMSSTECAHHTLDPESRLAMFSNRLPLTPSDSPFNDDRHLQLAGDGGCDNGDDAHALSNAPDLADKGLKFDMLDHLPGLRDSILALKASANTTITENLLQELGKNIAAQIAEAISQGRQASARSPSGHEKQKEPAWEYPELPQDQYQRTSAKPISPRARLLASSPGQPITLRHSIWAPVVPPKRRSRRRPAQAVVAEPNVNAPADPDDSSLLNLTEGLLSYAATVDNGEPVEQGSKQCTHCHAKVTTVWRSGPNGNVCNSCGLYFYRYGELRKPEPEHCSEDDPSPGQRRPKRPHAGPFTDEEDALIIKLKEIDRLTWPELAKHFPNRSWYSLQGRYSKKLNAKDCPARELLMEQGYSAQLDIYDAREDEKLIELKDEQHLDWAAIAEKMDGHTIDSIQLRYSILSGDYSPNLLVERPRGARQTWTKEEDELLIRSREVDKLSWDDLAVLYPTRTIMALQKRYRRQTNLGQQIRADHDYPPEASDHSGLTMPVPLAAPDDNDDPLMLSIASLLDDMDPTSTGSAIPRVEEDGMHRIQYSDPEDQLIMDLRDVHGLDWDMIHLWLPSRTITSIQGRYAALSHPTVGPHVSSPEPSFVATSDQPTDEMIVARDLLLAAQSDGIPYTAVNEIGLSNDVLPQTERPTGEALPTNAEDEAVVRLREQGLSWDQVSRQFPTTRPLANIRRQWEAKMSFEQARPPPTTPMPSHLSEDAATRNRRLQTLSAAPTNLFNSLLHGSLGGRQCHKSSDLKHDPKTDEDEDEVTYDLLDMNHDFLASDPHGWRPLALSSPDASAKANSKIPTQAESLVPTNTKTRSDRLGEDAKGKTKDNRQTVNGAKEHIATSLSEIRNRGTDGQQSRRMDQSSHFMESNEVVMPDANDDALVGSMASSPAEKQTKFSRVTSSGRDNRAHRGSSRSAFINSKTKRGDSSSCAPNASSPCIPESILSSSAGSPPVVNFAARTRTKPVLGADTLRRQLTAGKREKRKRETSNSTSRTPESTASHRKSSVVSSTSNRKRSRLSRRQSGIHKLEIPDTDDSECSWNSDRNDEISDVDDAKSVSTVTDGDVIAEATTLPSRHAEPASNKVKKHAAPKDSFVTPIAKPQKHALGRVVGPVSMSSPRQDQTPSFRPTPFNTTGGQNQRLSCGSTRRVVETPIKENEFDSSQDELA